MSAQQKPHPMVAEMTALASAAAAGTSNGTSQTTDSQNRRYIPRPQTYEQFQLLLLVSIWCEELKTGFCILFANNI